MTDGSSTSVQVRKVTGADLVGVADVLGRAFDDDPVMNFMAKPDARRSERIRMMMDLALRKLTHPFGETYVTEGFEGAALWNPPNGRPHGLISDLSLLPHMARIVGLRRMPRVLGALNVLEKKHPKEPHYYLLAIGVEPAHQGKGVGSQLMAPMLERCDREGMPAYLESSKERNLALYERHGFRVTEQITLPRRGPPAWLMWRDPQQRAE
jgi:ribosomal protein S18 acetylase RimI-like enzyme